MHKEWLPITEKNVDATCDGPLDLSFLATCQSTCPSDEKRLASAYRSWQTKPPGPGAASLPTGTKVTVVVRDSVEDETKKLLAVRDSVNDETEK